MDNGKLSETAIEFWTGSCRIPLYQVRNANFAMSKLCTRDPKIPLLQDFVNSPHDNENVALSFVEAWTILHNEDKKSIYNNGDRVLLAHGSPKRNLWSIVNERMRDQRQEGRFGLMGPGCYLTDSCIKAVNYSLPDSVFKIHAFEEEAGAFTEQEEPTYAYIFLCEVALGNMYENHMRRWQGKVRDPIPPGHNSAVSYGRFRRKKRPTCVKDGVKWFTSHFYKTSESNPTVCRKSENSEELLKYTEYVVYNPRRVIVKYLLKVKLTKKSKRRV